MFNPTNVTFQAAELLNVLDAVAKAKSGFRSLKDTWRTRQGLLRRLRRKS
jgi:hypothetical protein